MKAGDKLRNNNPRMDGRLLTITSAVDSLYVTAVYAGRSYVILRRRIYTDGKIRRSGFTLLPVTEESA